MLLGNTWLYRLWLSDRKLFVIVLLFITGTLFFALSQREEFPFLLYGMYSLKEESKPTYISYVLKVDGREVRYTSLWDLEKEVITSPLLHSLSYYEAGNLTSEQMQKQNAWLLTYLADMRLIEENTLEIERITCAYKVDGSVQILKRESIAKYAAN